MQTIDGACHCGNIRFRFTRHQDEPVIAVRECGCGFCVRHGGLWTSDPAGRLAIAIADDANVSRYQFGSATADFLVCRRCGVVPAIVSEIDGRVYGVVSVRAFDDLDAFAVRAAPADYSGEATDARLERRKANWIADVGFASALG